MRRTTRVCALTAAAITLVAPAGASAADAIYGVTDQNRLLRFNSDSPANVHSDVALRGLAANERVVGADVRPANDQLYVVTTLSRALQVNPTTGAVRPAFGPFSPVLAGTMFGTDFNPQADALRVVSDTEQNLRVTTAGATTTDPNLTYAPGDPGAGTNPSITAVAYSNSVPGATATELFGIDTARDALVRVNPPNAGTVTTIGALGVDVANTAAFDIAPAGNVAYAAVQEQGETATALLRVNLATGRATPSTELPAIAIPEGAGTLRGLAVAGTVPNDDRRPTMSVAFSSTILEGNTNVLQPSVSCDETCVVEVEAEVDGRDAGTGTATIAGPGRATVSVRLNAAARARIDRRGTELITLDIAAVDAAGNTTTQNNRVSRTQTLAGRRGGG